MNYIKNQNLMSFDVENIILEKFINSDLKIISLSKLKEYISFCVDKDLKEKIKHKSEHHHILLKSLFPEYKNLSQNPWNGVHLLHRDHYIAHSLLVEAIDSHKVSSAWALMNEKNIKVGKISKPEQILGPDKYATLRAECSRKHVEYLTKEYINENGEVTSVAKEAGKKFSIKLNKKILDENGNVTTKALQRGKKNSETVSREYMNENGEVTSISKERAIKTANSMMREYVEENGIKITKACIRSKNAAQTMNREYFNENGEVTTIYKEASKKCSETKNKEYINENAEVTTIYKEASILRSKTMREKGRKFNLYHIHLGLLVERISMAELNKMSQILHKKTKENYLGKDTSTKTKFTKDHKSLLIGLYTAEIKDKNE